MSVPIRYDRNSVGLGEVLVAPVMGEAMEAAAVAGVTVFESIAPRRSSRYASSAEVTTGIDSFPSPRQVAHLVARVPYATDVERRHGTLGKVADAIENADGSR